MATPPNLTIRYTHTGNTQDISTIFYNATEIPHVKCFVAGKYVVVSLASEESLKEHTSRDNTNKLASLGYQLVETREARCARTVMAFRVPRFLTEKTKEELAAEIAHKNDMDVEQAFSLNTKTPTLKIIVGNSTQADTLIRLGVRAFSIIIPPQQLEKERNTTTTQCMRCYKFTHSTNTCNNTTQRCSKCAGSGHNYRQCISQITKCLNCDGDHVAVSFDCIKKKEAAKAQKNPPTNPTPATTLAAGAQVPSTSAGPTYAATTASGAIPRQPNTHTTTQPPTHTPNPSLIDSHTDFAKNSTTLAAKIQLCSNAAAQFAGDDNKLYAELLPVILADNNLPTIIISPRVLELASKKTPTTISLPDNIIPTTNINTLSTENQQNNTPTTPIIPTTSTPKKLPLKSPPPPSPTSSANSSDSGSVSVCSTDTSSPQATQTPNTPTPQNVSVSSNDSQVNASEAEEDSASHDEAETQEETPGIPSDSSPPTPNPPQTTPSKDKHTPISHKTRSHGKPAPHRSSD